MWLVRLLIIGIIGWMFLKQPNTRKEQTYESKSKSDTDKESNDLFGINNNENTANKGYSTHSEYINSYDWKTRSYNLKLKANGNTFATLLYII
jgi:hypothetical protein